MELIVASNHLVIFQLSPFRLPSLLFPVLFSRGSLFSLPSHVLFRFALISFICVPLAMSNLRFFNSTHSLTLAFSFDLDDFFKEGKTLFLNEAFSSAGYTAQLIQAAVSA